MKNTRSYYRASTVCRFFYATVSAYCCLLHASSRTRTNAFVTIPLTKPRQPFISSSSPSDSSCLKAASDPRAAIDWFQSEPLELLLPKDDALQICQELLSDKELIDDSEELFQRNWQKLLQKMQSENRSIKELLGDETTQRLLDSVKNVNVYDSDAVRAFLESDAVNDLFARVLYDGIYEFFQTIDVFGNIISNLPIIGPIRNQIRDEIKRSLDRTLGPLVKGFLRSYTRVAVVQASDFVMSPSNQQAFGNANVRLVSSLLERPIASLLPENNEQALLKLQADAFEFVRTVNVDDLDEYFKFVYDLVGDKSISKAVNVNRILDASPTLSKTVDRLWERANENQAEATK